MADLRFIMDMDDQEPLPRTNKKDHETPPGPTTGPDPSRSASTTDRALHTNYERPALALSSRPVGLSSRPSTSSAAATPASSSASDLTGLTRRESTASTESMDPSGYGGRGRGMSSGPIRPIGSPSANDQSVRLTPITRRVSRAKKGVPVHTCEVCRPPKTFTRAEHLRRHNLSHETPRFACLHPGCDKVFHRQDLLNRHRTRHEQDDQISSRGDAASRRTSDASVNDGYRYGGPVSSAISASPSGHRGTLSMSSAAVYAHDPSSSYPVDTHVSSGGQSSTRTPPSLSQQPYGRSDRHGSPPNASGYSTRTRGSRSGRVPIIHQQPPSHDNTPTTPLRNFGQGFTASSLYHMDTEAADGSQHLPSLTIPDSLPGLLAPHDSPWASSASESNFSTPSEAQTRRSNARALSPPFSDWSGTIMSTYPPGSPMELAPGPSLFPSHPFSFSQHSAFLSDVPVSFQEEHVAILEHAHGHDPYSSVRSLTPQTSTSGAQPAEHLVTLSTAVPGTLPILDLGGSKDTAPSMPPFCLGNPQAVAFRLPRSVLSAIPDYLKVYWECFDVQFPIIHRATFETCGSELLRCAMAAIATQFMPHKDDQVKGKQIHEAVVDELKHARVLDSLPTMQAILLCEYYARFRGRKVVVTASRLFREIYTRMVRSQTTSNALYAATNSNSEQRWRQWADMEARRRLYTACFLLDVNSSIFYEQPLQKTFTASSPPLPLTAQTCQQWAAPTASSWDHTVPTTNSGIPSALFPLTDDITPEQLAAAPRTDFAVFLAAEVLRLLPKGSRSKPRPPQPADLTASDRICRLFPLSPMADSYMALYYTPLHDLLAVSGDSWVFASKVLTTEQFHEHQVRLKTWSQSQQAEAAVRFAAKSLCAFLALDDRTSTGSTSAVTQYSTKINANVSLINNNEVIAREKPKDGNPHIETTSSRRHTTKQRSPNEDDDEIRFNGPYGYRISDYWTVYACTLICWAVSHSAEHYKAGNAPGTDRKVASTRNNMIVGDIRPQAWLSKASQLSPGDVLPPPGSGLASGIASLARRRLQDEAVGGTSVLLNDALDVLSKLEDNPVRPLF